MFLVFLLFFTYIALINICGRQTDGKNKAWAGCVKHTMFLQLNPSPAQLHFTMYNTFFNVQHILQCTTHSISSSTVQKSNKIINKGDLAAGPWPSCQTESNVKEFSFLIFGVVLISTVFLFTSRENSKLKLFRHGCDERAGCPLA